MPSLSAIRGNVWVVHLFCLCEVAKTVFHISCAGTRGFKDEAASGNH